MYFGLELYVEKRPWLGVCLGALGLALGIGGFAYTYSEYRNFGPEPVPIVAAQARPPIPGDDRGHWVQLEGPVRFDCTRRYLWRNPPDQALLFGEIDATYFVATTEGTTRVFLIEFAKEVSCAEAQRRPLVGVLSGVNTRLLATLNAGAMDVPRSPYPLIRLCTRCGPKQSRWLMLGMLAITLTSGWMIRHFWSKAIAQRVLAERA